jgi:hypothetical protein
MDEVLPVLIKKILDFFVGVITNQWANFLILFQRTIVLLLKKHFFRERKFQKTYFLIITFTYYNFSDISHVLC